MEVCHGLDFEVSKAHDIPVSCLPVVMSQHVSYQLLLQCLPACLPAF